MRRKAGTNACARRKQTEGVPPAEAVPGSRNAGEALGLQVEHGLGQLGVDSSGVMREGPQRGVEAGRGEVEGRRVVVEHVRGNGVEAGAGERVGEQLVVYKLDAEGVGEVDEADLGLVAVRLGDIERCWSFVNIGVCNMRL